MNRPTRLLFDAASVLSFAVFIAATVLWARSYHAFDEVIRRSLNHQNGGLSCDTLSFWSLKGSAGVNLSKLIVDSTDDSHNAIVSHDLSPTAGWSSSTHRSEEIENEFGSFEISTLYPACPSRSGFICKPIRADNRSWAKHSFEASFTTPDGPRFLIYRGRTQEATFAVPYWLLAIVSGILPTWSIHRRNRDKLRNRAGH